MKRLNGKPFALLGVNSGRDREQVKEVIKERHQWTDFDCAVCSRWAKIYVLDDERGIRFQNVRGEAMDRLVDSLLAEFERK